MAKSRRKRGDEEEGLKRLLRKRMASEKNTSDLSIGDGVYHEKGYSTDDAACMVRVVKFLGQEGNKMRVGSYDDLFRFVHASL